jgi:hypothetical protein
VHGQQQTSLLVPLAEPEMLAASCGVPEVSMYMLPKPAALANVFLATPGWLLRSSLYRALLWLQFTLLRRWLLRARPTRVELFARARASATGELAEWSLTAADGMWTAGVAIAAIAHLLGQREQPAGVYCVDQRLSLAAVVSRMREIDPDCLAGV